MVRLVSWFDDTLDIESRGTTDVKVGMVGGLVFMLYPIPYLVNPELFSGRGVIPITYEVFLFIPVALMLFGLIGVHHHVKTQTGLLERVGYVSAFVGFVFVVLTFLYLYAVRRGESSLVNSTVRDLSVFIIVAGTALIGLDSWRSTALPRLGAGLFIAAIVGIPLNVLLNESGIGLPLTAIMITYGASWVVVGYSLSRPMELPD